MKKISVIIMISLVVVSLHSINFNYSKLKNYFKGKSLYQKSKFNESEKYFEKNAINYPKDGKLHYNLANNYYKNKKLVGKKPQCF